MLHRFNFLFPVWAILFSIFAYQQPEFFIPLKPSIIYLLAVVMLGMGISLTIDDFKNLLALKSLVLLGMVLQFTIMPLSAWIISLALGLSIPLLTGMLLVGCSPGGTASNVICYLAKGNVALSVVLTSCSTLIAVIATPLLTWIYLGQSVNVPVLSMMLTMLKIIVLPVTLGVLINHFLGNRLNKLLQVFPSISILSICLIIAIIIAANQTKLQSLVTTIVIAVVLHNIVGLLLGYMVSKQLGHNHTNSKTIAI